MIAPDSNRADLGTDLVLEVLGDGLQPPSLLEDELLFFLAPHPIGVGDIRVFLVDDAGNVGHIVLDIDDCFFHGRVLDHLARRVVPAWEVAVNVQASHLGGVGNHRRFAPFALRNLFGEIRRPVASFVS